MKNSRLSALSAAVAMALAAGSAHAVLERVGPVSTLNAQGGYPTWFQDKTGVALEFCDPKTQADVDGGWCLLLPGDPPSVPEIFPSSFFDEHFYFAADATLAVATSAKPAILVLAVEAAFANEVPIQGDQQVFARIRVRLDNVPVSGTYRFIHPYGEEVAEGVAGGRIFITDDIGIACPPGQFDCALASRLGPFLLPSNEAGGAELPPVQGPSGRMHIADPGRSGPVTGSLLMFREFNDPNKPLRTQNVFRLEGPPGSGLGGVVNGQLQDWVETSDFSLVGRLFNGSIAGRANIERANYTRGNGPDRVDVFATAFPTTQARVPATPVLPAVAPVLTVFGAPCTGTLDADGVTVRPPFGAPAGSIPEQQMFSAGAKQWAQIKPAAGIPTTVCVKDNSARDVNGNVIPTYQPQPVTDAVKVSSAFYDPTLGTLAVTAGSTDAVTPQTLTLGFNDFRAEMQNGGIQVVDLVAPPSKVQVFSSAGGMGELPVEVGIAPNAPAPTSPVAVNDAYSFAEDAPAQTLNLLANDTNIPAGVVTVLLTTEPRLGRAVVNANGTVTFTPSANAFGTDAFTYTVTAGGKTSNPANVAITIAAVNDKPLALSDSATAIVNIPVTFDVATNDVDADGNLDITGVANLTQPVGTSNQTGATVTANGRRVTFTATQPGTYNFTYRAQDSAGATSDNDAQVTVQVAAAETLNIIRSDYVRNKTRLRVDGNIAPVSNQRLTVVFTNNLNVQVGPAINTNVLTDNLGAWTLDQVVALPTGATRVKATSTNGTSQIRALLFK